MFKNYPDIKLAPPMEEINIKQETTALSGCVMYKVPERINKVNIALHALLRIAKHANEMMYPQDGGTVIGLHIGDTVEITNVIPKVRYERSNDPTADKGNHAEAIKKEKELFEMMLETHQDSYKFGIYTIAEVGRHLSKQVLDQLGTSPGVLLHYDRRRTELGRLYLRAYVLSDAYVRFRTEALATRQRLDREEEKRLLRNNGVYTQGILREVPVFIQASIDQKLFMQDCVEEPVLPPLSTTTPERLKMAEKLLGTLTETYKRLRMPVRYIDTGFEVEKGLLTLAMVEEQAQHLESLCDSILLSIGMVKKL